MKILLIKNTATQSISYILKAIKRKAPEAKLYVLAHEHTVDAMSQFQEVHKVIPYTPKDIFQYKKIDATTLNYFEKNKFDKIYFYHNRDAKAHFENVLFIARKLVSSGGEILGINLDGDEFLFTSWEYTKICTKRYSSYILVTPIFILLAASLPMLFLLSLVNHLRLSFSAKETPHYIKLDFQTMVYWEILSHRGAWLIPSEKNSRQAFQRSFELGFGLETDVRDQNGVLVISHDPPLGECLHLVDFLDIYSSYNVHLPLALNVKSDGIQAASKDLLERYAIKNYFFFDMSVPDTLGYIQHGLTWFSRQSEIEPQPVLYEQTAGVWLDCFYGEWVDENTVIGHVSQNKQICFVSPELHNRPHLSFWRDLKDMHLPDDANVFICTDLPEEAKKFFSEN